MNLLEQLLDRNACILQINKCNNECRLHGIREGGIVKVICRYCDILVVVLNSRETVTIPKGIAKDIIVRQYNEL